MVLDPERVRLTRRVNNAFGDGVHAIYCRSDTGDVLHSLRFSRERWTVARAKRWLHDNQHCPAAWETASKEKALTGWAFAGQAPVMELLPVGETGTSASGAPTRRFIKDLIRVGRYVHPVEGWSLDVTPDKLDQLAAAYHKMRQNGVDVEVVTDHSFKAKDVIGGLVDVYRRGDVLYGLHEFVGKTSIDLAEKVKNVSIWLEPSFVDGKANSYGEVILHSSLVQQPIVPDQAGFIPVEVAAGQMPAAVLAFSMQAMEISDMTEAQLKAIRTFLEDDKLVEADALAKLLDRHTALVADGVGADEKITAATKEIAALKVKIAELDKDPDGEPKVDQDAVELLAEGIQSKAASLVTQAKLTPAASADLIDALIGAQGSRNVRALSRVYSGGQEPLAKRVLAALEKNDPAVLGEQTKSQAVGLSRVVPGEPSTEPNEDIIKRQAGMTGMATAKA